MIDFTKWWTMFAAALQHDAFHAVFMAFVMGLALTEALAWIMPRRWSAVAAERTMRIVVWVAVALAGYQMHPTTIGAGWSFTVGALAPSAHHHLQAWAYQKWPALRPKVLRHDVYEERGHDQ